MKTLVSKNVLSRMTLRFSLPRSYEYMRAGEHLLKWRWMTRAVGILLGIATNPAGDGCICRYQRADPSGTETVLRHRVPDWFFDQQNRTRTLAAFQGTSNSNRKDGCAFGFVVVIRCESEKIMNTKIKRLLEVFPAIVLLLTASPLLAQMTPAQRLTQAFALEKEGKPAPAITELEVLLDSQALDRLSSGKAWSILGLAYEDEG